MKTHTNLRHNPKNSFVLIGLAVLLFITSCGGSEMTHSTSPAVMVNPPVVTAAVINTNVTNPTLKTFDNAAVTDNNNMSLVWSEEFDTDKLDPETWYFETGDGTEKGIPGWGNNELEYYLPDNAKIDNGKLIITAKQESIDQYNYTSARLHTQDRVAIRYGRVEASIKLPAGQGFWPAFWLLPQEDTYGTWAASGEIDIMEAVNLGVDGKYQVHGTIHHGAKWPDNIYTGKELDVDESVTTEFHTYAVEWEPDEIRWYMNDTLYSTLNDWSTTSTTFPAPFDRPFYILLNLAVGGNWPGAPNTVTVFPSTLEIDYIRVYQGN